MVCFPRVAFQPLQDTKKGEAHTTSIERGWKEQVRQRKGLPDDARRPPGLNPELRSLPWLWSQLPVGLFPGQWSGNEEGPWKHPGGKAESSLLHDSL